MKKPFSIPLLSQMLFHRTPKSVQEKLIAVYLWTLMTYWGHFSISLVAQYLKRHKAQVSRHMKNNLFLDNLSQKMLPKELSGRIGKKAHLIIDSTMKAKRGKKLCNLQKFKTSRGFIIGHCFVFALLICKDNSSWIIAVKPYLTKAFCRRTNQEFKTQNQLAVEILQEVSLPLETHVIVVADSAFVAHFIVSEITTHPQWSFVSSLDSNRKITIKGYTRHTADFKKEYLPALKKISISCNGRKNTLKVMSISAEVSKVGPATVVLSQRDRQTLALIGVGKRLSLRAICYAYLLRWRIEILFKELKQYLHFGSYHCRDFEAYMNHILLVILAYNILKSLYPKFSIAEAKKQVSQSSQAVFLYELKHDLTKFHGNRIVKNKIFQALSAMTAIFPLSMAG
ncbi:MAG: transposase [Candidatus Jettenia caeni]|nr:MAG: transposase [Candidatus Jettenia caeni]